MNQKTDRALFGWLLLASFLGVLAGVPWTLAVLRGYPGTAWWWEGAFSLVFLIAASAAGTWLGKRVDLGSGLRELVSGTPGCWKRLRLALVPGTLVGLALGLLQLISQGAVPKDALIPELNNPNALEWTLRCLSAALTEEIAFRFGLMSFFVWIIRSVVTSSRCSSAFPVDRQPAVSPCVCRCAFPTAGAATIWLEPLDSIRRVEHQCRYDYGLALHAIRPGFGHCRPSCRRPGGKSTPETDLTASRAGLGDEKDRGQPTPASAPAQLKRDARSDPIVNPTPLAPACARSAGSASARRRRARRSRTCSRSGPRRRSRGRPGRRRRSRRRPRSSSRLAPSSTSPSPRTDTTASGSSASSARSGSTPRSTTSTEMPHIYTPLTLAEAKGWVVEYLQLIAQSRKEGYVDARLRHCGWSGLKDPAEEDRAGGGGVRGPNTRDETAGNGSQASHRRRL